MYLLIARRTAITINDTGVAIKKSVASNLLPFAFFNIV
jgi:hypothetical protein